MGKHRAGFLGRHGQQLGIPALLIRHLQNAQRARLHHAARLHRMRRQYQHIQRIAVIAQSLRDIAVIGRIKHRRRHETVNRQHTAILVDFVLDRRGIGGNLDNNIENFRQLAAGRHIMDTHKKLLHGTKKPHKTSMNFRFRKT